MGDGKTWRDRLVVIDTMEARQPGGEARTDALLFNPGNDHTPYIVAQGYDPSTRSWSSGSYRHDLMDALCELRDCAHPDYSIPGMTPERVLSYYGRFYEISPDLAVKIARDVNEELESGVEWDLDARHIEAYILKNYDVEYRSQPDLVSESDLRDILSQLGETGLDLEAEGREACEVSEGMAGLDTHGREEQTR